jgi:hypothetical protein
LYEAKARYVRRAPSPDLRAYQTTNATDTYESQHASCNSYSYIIYPSPQMMTTSPSETVLLVLRQARPNPFADIGIEASANKRSNACTFRWM